MIDHLIQGDSLELNWNSMPKFDVVVGNPPFQPPSKREGQSGAKLWHKFIFLSFKITKDNGLISLITPAHWRLGNFSKSVVENVQSIMWENHIVSIKDVTKEFEGVAGFMQIDSWLIHKGKPNTMDKIFNRYKFFPIKTDKDLIKKYFEDLSTSSNDYILNIKSNDSRKFNCLRKTKEGDNDHPYQHVNTIAQYKQGFFDWYDVKTFGINDKKVIISNSVSLNTPGNYLSFYDEGKYGCGHNSSGFIVNNKEEGKNLENFLNNSKIIKMFIIEYNENGYHVPLSIFKKIPKSWVERFNDGEDL